MKQMVFLCVAGALLAAGLSGPSRAHQPSTSRYAEGSLPALEVNAPHTVPVDTIRRRVQAGRPLIMTLPAMLGGRPVASYRFLRAPALSWLIDRSILWRTRPEDVGDHAMLVGVALADAPPDTLTILVTVTE